MLFFHCMKINFWLYILDTGPYSPELVPFEKAVKELEEEPRSFSPELLHDSEGEEGLDPKADKVELVMLVTFTKLFS